MLPNESVRCHHTGFKSTCFDGVVKHKCPKWTHIIGTNPQTGEDIDKFGCSDTFMPLLVIENAQTRRQADASVESLRNVLADVALPRITDKQEPRLINGTSVE